MIPPPHILKLCHLKVWKVLGAGSGLVSTHHSWLEAVWLDEGHLGGGRDIHHGVLKEADQDLEDSDIARYLVTVLQRGLNAALKIAHGRTHGGS